MFEQLFKPILHTVYPCAIEGVRNNTQKEVRIIDTLEPVLNQHRLVVDSGLVQRDIRGGLEEPTKMMYSLFYQMTHITKDRGSLLHDDRLDVLTLVVNQWMNVLVQNPKQVLEDYKEKQRLASISHFMDVAKRASKTNRGLSRPGTKGLRAFR